MPVCGGAISLIWPRNWIPPSCPSAGPLPKRQTQAKGTLKAAEESFIAVRNLLDPQSPLAAWRIRDMATREVAVTQESRITQQAAGATRSEIVSAQSQAIVALSREIAGALRNIE